MTRLLPATTRARGSSPPDYACADPTFYNDILFALCSRWAGPVHGAHRPPLPSIVKDEARVRAALAKRFRSRNPQFQCLVHGDAHVGNAWLGSHKTTNDPRFLAHYLAVLRWFGGPELSIEDEEVDDGGVYLDIGALRTAD
ncbi:hypothetical protein F4821DRAFT_222748 [Hypoxylon rubiginosum]|uniref:Uncharacterized protein n=1 Tax=Hypoxylon rubiginosum TaxID=110542 RepID=A0ACC0DLG7_9PEZI|nr:hypothetical protein F4821DRAFT_222748 [Hypoxylon rubiginosum]